jgi:hypothetical protein
MLRFRVEQRKKYKDFSARQATLAVRIPLIKLKATRQAGRESTLLVALRVGKSVNELSLYWDDGDFEVGPEPLVAGESSAMATDCNELLAAIDEGRWDDCDELTHRLYGQIEDITIGERATRRSYDTVFEKFEEALAFLQSVEYTAIWIPTTPELLTVEEFEHVDRGLQRGQSTNPD